MSTALALVPATQDFLNTLYRDAPADVLDLRPTMQYGDGCRYVTNQFHVEDYPNGIEIIHITDVQYGAKECADKRFLEYINWILKEPNRFVLLGGDLIDCATALSVASPYDNTMPPMRQVHMLCMYLMPIRHRILGYVGGNHERRTKKVDIDLGSEIAGYLKIPYSPGKQHFDFFYGAHKPFKAAMWHGGSGSRTKGAKLQMLHRFMMQGEAQCYFVGHLHDAMMTFDWRTRQSKGRITLEKFAGCMSSSFLDHYGSYAEVAGMAPTGTMMWRLILEPNGHWELTAR